MGLQEREPPSVGVLERQLLDAAEEAAVATDAEGRVVVWNRAAERLLGARAAEAKGRRLEEVASLPPLAPGASVETTLRRRDGDALPARVSASTLRDDEGGTWRAFIIADLRRSRAAEAERAEVAERLARVMEATQDVVWEYDVATRQVWRSARYAEWGRSGPAGVVDEWSARVHPEDRDRVMTTFQAAVEGRIDSWTTDYRFRREDGTYADVSDRGSTIRGSDGRVLRVVGAMVDISSRKAAEREVEAARRALASHEKLTALGTLVSGVAHEVRTPLAYIATNLHIAKLRVADATGADRAAREEVQRALDEAANGVDRINRLVLELRRFSKAPTAARSARPLDEPVSAAVGLFRATAKGRAVVQADLSSPRPLPLDDAQVQQLVLNLLDNAADARPGGVVRVRTWEAEGRALLEVADEGPGIPPEVRARMFEAFFTTKPQGMGLGLAIVSRIVKDHGGELAIDSVPGKGTRVQASFPLT